MSVFLIEDRKTRASREAFEAFQSLRQDVKNRNLPELTLDEINAEIAATRAEQGVQQIEKGQFLTADECSQRRQQLMFF